MHLLATSQSIVYHSISVLSYVLKMSVHVVFVPTISVLNGVLVSSGVNVTNHYRGLGHELHFLSQALTCYLAILLERDMCFWFNIWRLNCRLFYLGRNHNQYTERYVNGSVWYGWPSYVYTYGWKRPKPSGACSWNRPDNVGTQPQPTRVSSFP